MRLIRPKGSRSGPRTFGRIESEDGQAVCVTLEHPWVDADGDGLGDRSVSCAPPGTFRLILRPNAETRHDYDVYELVDVPGRSNIQVHIGNLLEDTDGCILTGTAIGNVKSKKTGQMELGITGSRNAYDKWMAEVARETSPTLTIVEE